MPKIRDLLDKTINKFDKSIKVKIPAAERVKEMTATIKMATKIAKEKKGK